MAYLKPPVLTRRVANPLAMKLNARNVATLTVAGRAVVPYFAKLPDAQDHPVFHIA